MIEQTPVERALDILARLEPPPPRQQPIPCPTPEHEDKNPSALHYPDGGWYCHACGVGGDALDLYAIRNNFTVSQALRELGAFDGTIRIPRKPQPRNVYMPESVKDILVSTSEYALRWETAKLLAIHEPAQVKQDILAGWDVLLERGVDIPETLKLVNLIRGVALFRHANPARAHEPSERSLAVRRLLREIREVGV